MMTCHFDKRNKNDGKLWHPVDGSQWRKIDGKYQDFGREHRNVRFMLSTNGMNPFGDLSSTHSTWPVVLSILNLPSYLCMKRKYLMLAILIQGPRQPRMNIDVFLVPLLEDMAKLESRGMYEGSVQTRGFHAAHYNHVCGGIIHFTLAQERFAII